jgi:hypothetical protein
MERATRTDQAPEREVVESEQNETQTQDGGARLGARGVLPLASFAGAPQARTASERGFDDAPAPLTVQERSGLLAHKFDAMKGTPQMEAYVTAVSAHDAAVARYRGASQGTHESRTDVDAAKRAMEAAEKQELRARSALNAAAETWQPVRTRELGTSDEAEDSEDRSYRC